MIETDLYFLNFLNFPFGIDHDPHVLYVHMTYDYSSYSYVSHFTQSHGQEKSLSYYDLFNFRVLLYGHTPTLISFIHFLYTPTSILTIDVFIIGVDLKEYVRWPRCMEKGKILTVQRRTTFSPH